LYAQLGADGKLQLVNHLGIDLGSTPEEILGNLQNQRYQPRDVLPSAGKGHDHAYCHHVRQVDADTPARFNADPARHYEASGSAGKLAVFAVRLDTFPLEKNTAVFYIGTNSTAVLNDLRRHMLARFTSLPISGEYIHRDAFDIAAVYGKDTFWVIQKLGTHRLPELFALKAKIDRFARHIPLLPKHFADKALQCLSSWLPQHLPQKLRDYRNQYEHHLILKMGGDGVNEARQYLQDYFGNAERGGYFECDATETQAAMLHRFAVASAAVRYRAVHDREVEDIVALDIALRRNDPDWFEQLPPEIDERISHKLYYGHFMCHVFHQDYIVKKGNDCMAVEYEMLDLLDQRGAQYPAEHNVGHLYHAKPALARFYRKLDPTNSFNPGIGHTSKKKHWA
ncbi:MAG: D-lactate dehydrogenase, partial [Lautropia sp.]|nr:D-lactate dehydrogenase [Lautropia sp.]